jgi:dihydrofolate synthase/folylpolyglutamate synthase
MSYQETIAYLFGLQKHGIKLGLANSRALMEGMGDPHRRFRSFHIAGTNGKGSTAAFLAAMLRQAGYRVGLYTSPHLVHFTERIRIDGVPIAEEQVVSLAERVRDASRRMVASEGGAVIPTFFEVTTTMAFTYFAEAGVDIAVVEAGMGGRLDSTNVVTPLVSVITNIDLEHTEFLGTTVEQIAAEKAGIIKPGVPVVTAAAQPDAIAVLVRDAARHGAPLYRLPKDFGPEQVRSGPVQHFDHRGISGTYRDLAISMRGRYQVNNACLAVAAIECAANRGIIVPEAAVREGLARTVWEGRLERVAERPDLYLDGAHNPASAAMLAEALTELKGSYGRLVLVLGILQDKDIPGIIGPLARLADRIIVTSPHYARAAEVGALAAAVRPVHPAVADAPTVEDAIALARRGAGANDLIVVTGSLFTVGDARAALVASPTAGLLGGLKG